MMLHLFEGGGPLFVERTISGATTQSEFGTSGLNLVFVVALALGIAFLAQYLSRRRKK